MMYLDLFLGFLKVGCFAFGGAYGAIPLIRDVVLSYGWLNDETLAYMIAVSESTPGPLAVNVATYVGAEVGGLLGAVCSTLGVALPAFMIILVVAKCYEAFKSSHIVKGCMSGLKPGVVGLIGTVVAHNDGIFKTKLREDFAQMFFAVFMSGGQSQSIKTGTGFEMDVRIDNFHGETPPKEE